MTFLHILSCGSLLIVVSVIHASVSPLSMLGWAPPPQLETLASTVLALPAAAVFVAVASATRCAFL
jgi:hypothetical protein